MCFLALFAMNASFVLAEDYQVYQSDNVELLFPAKFETVAKRTAQMISPIQEDLQRILNFSAVSKPTVILMGDSQRFRQMADSPLVIGFAIPQKDMIVIDFSRVRQALEFKDILTHELCHLMIHKNIDGVQIPRWLDEGIAQWVSNGTMDITLNQKDALLPKAVLSDRVIPLGALTKDFPRESNRLRLAYEESSSFIDYLIAVHGKDRLLEVLKLMKDGMSLREAIFQTMGRPLYRIEEQWRASLRENVAWFAHLSYYLYEFLFAFGGLMVIYAFFRMVKKKRAYMDE